MNILFLTLVASLGGFLFGYDTAVISGCEEQIQKVFALSGFLHGAVASACVWGVVVGAFAGGRLTDAIGRKAALLGCAPWVIFAFFGACLTSMVFWAIFLMPGTKGKELN